MRIVRAQGHGANRPTHRKLQVPEAQVDWSYLGRPIVQARPYAEPKALNALVDAINQARQPIIVSGSGVLWSHAWDEMKAFVEKAGIPFYTTPQGRGVVPDDHPCSYLTMRNDAFREADLIIILGTRTNYVIGHALPPRFSADACFPGVRGGLHPILCALFRIAVLLKMGVPLQPIPRVLPDLVPAGGERQQNGLEGRVIRTLEAVRGGQPYLGIRVA
jgi:hypothetical protein